MKVKISGDKLYQWVHMITTHTTESSGFGCPELKYHREDFPKWLCVDAEPLEPCFEHKSWKTLCAECDPDYPGKESKSEK